MKIITKLTLCVSLSVLFSLIAIEIVKRISGRQYRFLNCKGATVIFHDEWTSSPKDCSIVRIKNGVSSSVIIDSTEFIEMPALNRIVLGTNDSESRWVHWATVTNAIVYMRTTNDGVEFIKWRDGFAIFGHAVSSNYSLTDPSVSDSVVNWHISNIRRSDAE
jgi:hypothetical protein